MNLEAQDPEAFALLKREQAFRKDVIDLVPSDNHPSPAVRACADYPLFYSENDGRNYYYPACETVAEVEDLAKARALKAFEHSEHVNVKPTDGTRGNEAVYRALLNDGDTILSLGLAAGGHLSHGLKWNYSGQIYKFVHYGVTESGILDMDEVRKLAKEHQPKMIIAGGSSCPFQWDFAAFSEIAKEVSALLHADISHFGGLVASGHHPSPFPHADSVMTTLQKTIGGAKGAIAFCKSENEKVLNRAVFPGVLAHATGAQLLAKAVVLGEVLQPAFKERMGQVVRNAKALASGLINRGHALVTGGTETHLLVVDLSKKEMTGKKAQATLQAAGLLANKQLVPNDPRKPTVCSGLRLGSPCVTTRGMNEGDMDTLAGLVHQLLEGADPEALRPAVLELSNAHPIQ